MVDGCKPLFFAALLFALTVCVGADAGGRSLTTRHDLVGAWRLVRIEVTGPRGSVADPFYGTGSEGLLVYDAGGWFSVQIMGSHRPALSVPTTRPEHADSPRQALKAEALESYYAYNGTWTFDAAASTVTHQAKGALYPAEQDAVYPQQVEVHGNTMTFTRPQGEGAGMTIQIKVWERAACVTTSCS